MAYYCGVGLKQFERNNMTSIYGKNCLSFLTKDYILLKIIFTTFALIFIFDTFYTLLVLKPTYTSHERRPMNVEDIPEIIICPKPSTNITALNLIGYPSPEDYYKGQKYGWTGNKSEDVKKVSADISNLKSSRDCGSHSFFGFDTDEEVLQIPIKFNLTQAISPFHICCKVIPPEISQSYTLQNMWAVLNFYNTALNKSDKVFLAEKLTHSIFDQHKTSTMVGDRIISSDDGLMNYKVLIIEEINLEGDPKNPCYDYKIIGEYEKCVKEEVVRENSKFINCTPPWMTTNEDLWCKGKMVFNSTHAALNHVIHLAKVGIIEARPKKCLDPCRQKRFQIKEIGVRTWKAATGVSIWFENEVHTSKAVWQLNEKTLISNIGGFIGIAKEFLWLIIILISSLCTIISYGHMKK